MSQRVDSGIDYTSPDFGTVGSGTVGGKSGPVYHNGQGTLLSALQELYAQTGDPWLKQQIDIIQSGGDPAGALTALNGGVTPVPPGSPGGAGKQQGPVFASPGPDTVGPIGPPASGTGGSGGGSGGSGGGGGGGGVAQSVGEGQVTAPESFDAWLEQMGLSGLNGQVAGDLQNQLSVNPQWQETILSLLDQYAANAGQLRELDPAQAAALDAQLAADRGAVNQQFQDTLDQQLLRAFAGGTQQSTVFGEAASRSAQDRALVELNLTSNDANQRLSMRAALTDQFMRSLDSQLAGAQGGAQIDLANLGLQLDQRQQKLALLDSQLSAYQSQQALAENSRQFGLDLGFRYKELKTNASLQRAAIGVQRMNAMTAREELDLRDQWHADDTNFARLQWLEGVREWGLEYEQNDRSISAGIGAQRDANRRASQNAWLATIGTVISAFA